MGNQYERALQAWACLTIGIYHSSKGRGPNAYTVSKLLDKPVNLIQKSLRQITQDKLPIIKKIGSYYFPTGGLLPWLFLEGMSEIGQDLLLRGDLDNLELRRNKLMFLHAA
jgi:hypothetical protein